ncbi:HEAT repeat domain-containing protein [Kitasatospora indigofera]|uniref:HEAT repeat domain-containing protein n=1 Tax=Kitasatospora indigofera TaxID=67307 RepID=UPI00367ADCBC
MLGRQCPDREETWQVVLTATTDANPYIRSTALNALGRQWPDREDTRQVVLTATTDTNKDVRSTALHVLVARFPDAAYPVVCEHAHRAQPTDLRVAVAKLLALLWPREPETLVLLTALASHDEEVVSSTAREALALVHDWSALAAG